MSIRSSLRVRGLFGTLQLGFLRLFNFSGTPHYLLSRMVDLRRYDREHGVETAGIIELDRLVIDSPSKAYGTRYGGATPSLFKEILDRIPIDHKNYSFIDIGSGKGAALFQASDYPFKQIIGKEESEYIPALGYDRLTFLYDPVVRWTTREAPFKAALVEQAQIRSGHRVLDLACGTATLTIAVKWNQPQADVIGIDGDPAILKLATAKADQEGVDVTFDEGLSYELPYADASFDRVVSSLFFHHLTRENKLRTLAEVWRVLRPGTGEIVYAFEVEKSTSIYSGILRLEDLARSLPERRCSLYLIAPDKREREVLAQLARPAFRNDLRDVSLAWIPFSELECHCDALSKFGEDHTVLRKIARGVPSP